MTRQQIERFFRVLAREFDAPVAILLTGAAAGALWGPARPSLDVDFGVQLRGGARRWALFEAAVERTVRLTGIQANYTQDLDRWGAITLLDYRRHTRLYRRFGALTVRLLDPAYWAIGKLTRYLDPDVRDLVSVLKAQRVPVDRLARLLGRALRHSPRSVAVTQFRRQTEHFLRTYGRAIWGRRFDAEAAVRLFHRSAGGGVSI